MVSLGENFSWGAAGAWAGFFALLAVLVRQIVPWKRLSVEADQRFREDLVLRVEKLEKTLEQERARHAAERQLDRHKFNNLSQCFDAVMLMLEAAPEKAGEIISKIKAMRAEQLAREAAEKATIRAAEIGATHENQ